MKDNTFLVQHVPTRAEIEPTKTPQRPMSVEFKVLTHNVCTFKHRKLKNKSKQLSNRMESNCLQINCSACYTQQYLEHKIMVACLQGTRMDQQTITKDGYIQTYSGTQQGNCSCAILISDQLPYANDGKREAVFLSSDVHLIHDEPRLLVVCVSTKCINIQIISGHTPTADDDYETKKAFWDKLGRYISDTVPTIISVDGNARAHLIREGMRQTKARKDTRQSAQLFAEFLQDSGVHTPALTLPHAPKPTYMEHGEKHTIDYIVTNAKAARYITQYD